MSNLIAVRNGCFQVLMKKVKCEMTYNKQKPMTSHNPCVLVSKNFAKVTELICHIPILHYGGGQIYKQVRSVVVKHVNSTKEVCQFLQQT